MLVETLIVLVGCKRQMLCKRDDQRPALLQVVAVRRNMGPNERDGDDAIDVIL